MGPTGGAAAYEQSHEHQYHKPRQSMPEHNTRPISGRQVLFHIWTGQLWPSQKAQRLKYRGLVVNEPASGCGTGVSACPRLVYHDAPWQR